MRAWSHLSLLAAALGAVAAYAAEPHSGPPDMENVEVVLADFSFTPKTLTLRHGQAYRLHFLNRGSGGHSFSAPKFFAAAQIDPDDVGKVRKGKIDLGKGEDLHVDLVPAGGTYAVRCTHFMHSALGMKGSIEVN